MMNTLDNSLGVRGKPVVRGGGGEREVTGQQFKGSNWATEAKLDVAIGL